MGPAVLSKLLRPLGIIALLIHLQKLNREMTFHFPRTSENHDGELFEEKEHVHLSISYFDCTDATNCSELADITNWEL